MKNFLSLVFIIGFIVVIHFGGRYLIEKVFGEKTMDTVDVIVGEVDPYRDLSLNKFLNEKEEGGNQEWDLSFLLNSDNPCDKVYYYSDKASETLEEEDLRELSTNWVDCGISYFGQIVNIDDFKSEVDARVSLLKRIYNDRGFRSRRTGCKIKRKNLDPKKLSEMGLILNLCDFVSYIDHVERNSVYTKKEDVGGENSYSPNEINEKVCNIKGNVSFDGGEKIYHLPGCPDYNATKINTAYGERRFCSEQEAINAGWRKAYNCDW